MSFQHPLYEAEIRRFNCGVELLVNDVFSYCAFEPGGSTLDWPVNELILKSGIQQLEFRMLPVQGQTTLSEKARARVAIYVREAHLENVPRQLVYESKDLTVAEGIPGPVQLVKATFPATVPYQIQGWSDSVDLTKEDEELLQRELLTWNRRLLNIYKTANTSAYKAAYQAREAEFDTFFYTTPEEQAQGDEDLFHSKFKDLVALPDELYKLIFYANGRLASVRLPYKPPGFTFDPSTKTADSLGISLTALFHRKAKGQPLEIIR